MPKKIKLSKKTKSRIWLSFATIIIVLVSFMIGRQVGLSTDTSTTSTTIEEVTVGTQTIKKTLTSSGEIASASTEKLTLSTTQYFSKMLVETDDIVKSGENILQYTDGTYLTAPYDLVITNISVPTTGTIASSNNYIEVSNMNNLIINLSINESEIANLKVDDAVEITLTADSNKIYTGKISKLSSVGNYFSSGSTFSAVVSFENDGDVKIGMSATCSINISELENVLAVPINAVQINGNERYVVVVENGETKNVTVTTGLSDDEYVEIKSGLTGGETVQVITTTKQNTVRNNNSESSNERGGGFQGGEMRGGDNGGTPPEMPSGSEGGNRPSRGSDQ